MSDMPGSDMDDLASALGPKYPRFPPPAAPHPKLSSYPRSIQPAPLQSLHHRPPAARCTSSEPVHLTLDPAPASIEYSNSSERFIHHDTAPSSANIPPPPFAKHLPLRFTSHRRGPTHRHTLCAFELLLDAEADAIDIPDADPAVRVES